MLPHFIIAGASRSGTTILFSHLGEHPDTCVAKVKEVRFFDKDENYLKGQEYYESFFEQTTLVAGEASPPYFYTGITFDGKSRYHFDPDDDAPTRIRKMLPDVKIIMTLRNPVTRLYSQYLLNLRKGREENIGVREAVERELSGKRRPEDSGLCWLYKNRYGLHLEKWFTLFPRENILVLNFDIWKKNLVEALNRIAAFLGVKADVPFADLRQHRNVQKAPRNLWVNRMKNLYFPSGILGRLVDKVNLRPEVTKISENDFHFLLSVLENEMNRLENLLGWDVAIWRDYSISTGRQS